MSGQHANVKGAALTLHTLLVRLLAETRAELADKQRPYGRHAVRTPRQSSTA
jgi:hypothetical protein